MSYEVRIGLASNPLFRKKIRLATVIAAVDIQGEEQGATPEGAFQKRQALATKVIKTAGIGTPDEDLLAMFVWAVIANVSITAESSDSDIQFTVNSVWSDAAGVTGAEV